MEDIGGADDAPPGSPGEAIRAFRDEIHAGVAGPSPSDAERVRSWAILGCMQCAVVKTMDLPQETVRDTLLALALAVHDSHVPGERGRSSSGKAPHQPRTPAPGSPRQPPPTSPDRPELGNPEPATGPPSCASSRPRWPTPRSPC